MNNLGLCFYVRILGKCMNIYGLLLNKNNTKLLLYTMFGFLNHKDTKNYKIKQIIKGLILIIIVRITQRSEQPKRIY